MSWSNISSIYNYGRDVPRRLNKQTSHWSTTPYKETSFTSPLKAGGQFNKTLENFNWGITSIINKNKEMEMEGERHLRNEHVRIMESTRKDLKDQMWSNEMEMKKKSDVDQEYDR